jgi:ketosteroid isomerase-like protein
MTPRVVRAPKGRPVSDDVEQIRRTLGEYSRLCDDGRFDEFADLFTTDARLLMLGEEFEGRDAIAATMAAVQPDGARGLHMTANSLVDVDGAQASATTDYVFVRPSADGLAVIAAGRYYDRFRRDVDRWRFSERRITLMGRDGSGSG